MKRKKNKNENGRFVIKKGFSLLEMLIAMFIFALVIVTSIGVFSKTFLARSQARKIQKNIEEARTAVDTMAKNIRMSSQVTEVTTRKVYMYNNSQNQCISYRYNNNALQSARTNPADPLNPDCSTVNFDPLYSNITGNVLIDGRIYVAENGSSNGAIGYAVISIQVDLANTIQTSVSFRDYKGIIQ